MHYDDAYYFQNVSQQRCVVAGFPGVHYLDAQRRSMAHTTSRGGRDSGFPTSYRPLPLAPGAQASFELAAYDYDARGNKNCPKSTFLAVFPPDNKDRIVIRDSEPVCGDTVNVSPLRAFRAQDAHTD